MNLCLVLALLLCMGASGENKINLEDIERDNLRAEGAAKSGNAGLDEAKLPSKSEIVQQRYRVPNQYQGPSSAGVAYVTPSPVQNAPPETYVRANKYGAKEQAYQQQNDILAEELVPPRYYSDYQQQSSLPLAGLAASVQESQQLFYQPEVNVGNRLQAAQQSTVTAKYAKDTSRGVGRDERVSSQPTLGPSSSTPVPISPGRFYVDVPAMHLLAYYPNFNPNSIKTGGLLVPRVAVAPVEHVSIPLYTPMLSQKPFIAAKPRYQIEFAPRHTSLGPAVLSTKIAKDVASANPVAEKKYTGAPFASVPTFVPSDQSPAQGRRFLYTQAYIAPAQPRYVSRLVYAQPATSTVYMHATPVYNDDYVRPPTYVQDNSLQGNAKYGQVPSEQADAPAEIADESPNRVSSQHAGQTVPQSFGQDPLEPSTDLVPPQLPAQDFESAVTPLLPVPSEDEQSISEENHVDLSEPRSLLDSYVPSKLIAAQDAARYQERPIRLESGFLPSKENFARKKRETN